MTPPPINRSEFWVRFFCFFPLFGVLVSLYMLRHFHTVEKIHIACTLGVTTLLATLAAKRRGVSEWFKW